MANNFLKRVSFFIQRRSHTVQLRSLESNLLKLVLPKGKVHDGINALKIQKTDQEIFTDLKNDGFSDLGLTLSTDQIEAIKNELKKLNCYNTAQKNAPAVDLNNVGKDVQLAHYKRDDLAKIDSVMQIANDSKVLNAVTKYLGIQPTISNINCWWSFGDRESAKEAQFYHRDLDDFKFLKMFIYLTDVNDQSGPHIYVKGSHRSNKLKELRRFGDDEVNSLFNSNDILTLTKSKGNTFIEDTYGIHKGQLPLQGNRLIIQFQYSYFPLHVETYTPQNSAIMKNTKLDKYTNRLLLTQ